MKELTIEQKAARYDEALKRAKKLYEQGTITESLGYVFPELKESKDEKIKRFLLESFKSLSKACPKSCYRDDITYKDIVAWLEKQGEQKPTEEYNIRSIGSKHAEGKLGEMIKNLKPADKVEPKFKVGDWIVQKNIGIYKVIEVCESWYEVIDNKDKHYSIGFDKEYMCHL